MFNPKVANEGLLTIDIKGKGYVQVNDRINGFRKACPEGTIETDVVWFENGQCLVKATIKDDEGKVLGTGHAWEKETSSFINKTSFLENCETSAVGRALGMCGIGIDTSIASYEEVGNAIHQQDMEKQVSQGQGKRIENKKKVFADKYGKTIEETEKWLEEQNLTKPSDIEKLLDTWIMKKTEPKEFERTK